MIKMLQKWQFSLYGRSPRIFLMKTFNKFSDLKGESDWWCTKY